LSGDAGQTTVIYLSGHEPLSGKYALGGHWRDRADSLRWAPGVLFCRASAGLHTKNKIAGI
jgi:hypothetical protein